MNRSALTSGSGGGGADSPAKPDPDVAPSLREESLHQAIDHLSFRLDEIVATRDEARARSLTVMFTSVGIAATLIVLGAGPLFGLSWTEAWWWIVGVVLGFPLVTGIMVWATNRLAGRPGPPVIEGEVDEPSDRLHRLRSRYEQHFGSLEQVVHSLTGPSVAAMAVGACMLGYGIWEAVRVGGIPVVDLLSIGGGVGMLGMGAGVHLMARWWDQLPALQSDIRQLATEVERFEPPDDPSAARLERRMHLQDELDRSHDVRSTAWSAVRWGAVLLLGWSVLFLLDGSLVSIVMMLALVGAMTASDVRTLLAERRRRIELEERLDELDGRPSAPVAHPE